MPIIDKKRQRSGKIVLIMLKEHGTVALYNDDAVYCFECMFEKHSHEIVNFWSLDADAIVKNGKIYICDECGKEIS
jgi:hypothetical protein